MIVAIAPVGTGVVPVTAFVSAPSVAQGVVAYAASKSPPLNPADFMGHDTGWTENQPATPGSVWALDRDLLTLSQEPVVFIAIAPAGTGVTPAIAFVKGIDVADGIANYVNQFDPPLDPADFVGVNTGWTTAQEPDAGKVWVVDRDALSLLQMTLFIIAIAPTGTGVTLVTAFMQGINVSDGINNFCNAFEPAKDPADYVGLDTTWTAVQDPAPGMEWSYDRDADNLVQTVIPEADAFSGSSTSVRQGLNQTVELPAASMAQEPIFIEYESITPSLSVTRKEPTDKINGVAQNMTGMPTGFYLAVRTAIDSWALRSLQTHAYDAVVRPDGCGDFKTISDAVDAGSKSIFVAAGAYVESADLDLPEDAAIIGASPGAVVLQFTGGASLKFSGAARKTTAGTITATTGSPAIVGAGTAFTELQVGDWVRVGAVFHKVAAIADDTNLTLGMPYQGKAYNGDYVGQSMKVGLSIQNMIIAGSQSHGLVIEQAFHAALHNTLITTCGLNGTDAALAIVDSSEVHAIGFVTENCFGPGIEVKDSTLIRLETCACKNNGGHGIQVLGCRDATVDAGMCLQNAGDGILVDDNTEVVELTDCILQSNQGNGIRTVAGVEGVVISSSTCKNNGGWGVDYAGSDSMVEGCIIEGNGSGGIEAGNRGVVNGNQVSNNDGMGISIPGADNSLCSVSGNVVHDNTSDGISVGSNGVVSNNVVYSNQGWGINAVPASNDSVISSNRVRQNNAGGIRVETGATQTILAVNNCRQNTGPNLEDNGTGTTLSANKS